MHHGRRDARSIRVQAGKCQFTAACLQREEAPEGLRVAVHGDRPRQVEPAGCKQEEPGGREAHGRSARRREQAFRPHRLLDPRSGPDPAHLAGEVRVGARSMRATATAFRSGSGRPRRRPRLRDVMVSDDPAAHTVERAGKAMTARAPLPRLPPLRSRHQPDGDGCPGPLASDCHQPRPRGAPTGDRPDILIPSTQPNTPVTEPCGRVRP
jgi:hypothetical protein